MHCKHLASHIEPFRFSRAESHSVVRQVGKASPQKRVSDQAFVSQVMHWGEVLATSLVVF